MTVSASNLPIVINGPTSGNVGGNIRIALIYWYNPISVGDLVVLNDDQGNLIWPGRCETQNQSQIFRLPQSINPTGYNVPTLQSGTLLLFRV